MLTKIKIKKRKAGRRNKKVKDGRKKEEKKK